MRTKKSPKGKPAAPSYSRLGNDSLGILFLVASLCMAVALWGYSPLDPCWNTAIDSEILNPLGAAGSIFADGVFQVLGLSAFVVVLFVARLGVFFLFGIKKPHLGRILGYGALAAVCIMSVASALEGMGTFLGDHRGGILGAIISWQIGHVLLHFSMAVPQGVMTLVYTGIGALSFYWGLGIPWRHWATGFRWISKGSQSLYRSIASIGHVLFYRSSQGESQSAKLDSLTGPRLRTKRAGVDKPLSRDHDGLDPSETLLDPMKRARGQEDESGEKEFYSGFEEETIASALCARVASAREKRSKTSTGLIDLSHQVNYAMPSLDLLHSHQKGSKKVYRLSDSEIQERAKELESVLEEFGVRGEINRVRPGPVVTLFELTPAPGIKSSRIVGLSDDIARSMSAISARVAVIPGQNAIGIEMPNEHRETVYLRTLLETEAFERTASRLPLALEKISAVHP